MIYILLIVFGFCLVLFPITRCAVINFPAFIYYSVKDIYKYLKYKEWFVAPYGQIRCYIAQNSTSFGCGKTLSAVDYLTGIYNQYNNKFVFDSRRNKWVTQKIHILSNVDFKRIPYEKLVSLQQFVQETDEDLIKQDDDNDTLTVTYMYIDEASSQLNSRSFKSNFNALFISRLLTARHVHASIVMTSQRSGMVDKLMREVTNLYIGCRKIWRFQLLYYYDAYEVELAAGMRQVLPLKRTAKFLRDDAFARYDTYSSVADLAKDCKEGKVLSEAEILALQGQPDVIATGSEDQHGRRRIFGGRRARRR